MSCEDTIMEIAEKGFSGSSILVFWQLGGLSIEAQLKMLELTAGEVVTAYESPLGFRHGPKSIVNEDTAIIVFNSTNAYTRQYDQDLLKELHADKIAKTILVIDNRCERSL